MRLDWRAELLADCVPVPVDSDLDDPLGFPDYTPRRAVTVARGRIAGQQAVAVVWDFRVYGGSFSVADADAFTVAARVAAVDRVPLVSFLRSGGTRLQEGVPALVGIVRARLALAEVAAAHQPYLAVCDMPTTGGVWISTGSTADLRLAVAGATIGFAGPRVVEAMTGTAPRPPSHTAGGAYAAGLVDAVVPGEQIGAWLGAALTALAPGEPLAPLTDDADTDADADLSEIPDNGWAQVRRARARTRSGGWLLTELVEGPVDLRARHGDSSVRAVIGRLGGAPLIGVALAAELAGQPTADGYRLLTRAADLAGRLDLPLLTLIDTPGALPTAAAERDGIAAAIAAGMDAVLGCRGRSVSLVHGEGGSGGALAAAVTDRVLVTDDSYFTALGPEGAAAALGGSPARAADRMGVRPSDLHAAGFADRVLPARLDPPGLAAVVANELAALAAVPTDRRLERRHRRWADRLR